MRGKEKAVAKYLAQFIEFIKSPKEPAVIVGVAFYTLFIMSTAAVAHAGYMFWGVYSGDQVVSVVRDPAEARTIISQLIEDQRQGEASVMLERLSVKKTDQSGPILEGEALKLAINDIATSRVKGTEVLVNGKSVLALKNHQDANRLLDALKGQYGDSDVSTAFVEDVKLVDTMVEKIRLMSVETALDFVKGGTQRLAVYEVKSGDTLWDIAYKSGASVDDLVALNPGLKPDSLGLGDQISLSRAESLINVQTMT
ncbi:MAG: LysM peptidoglycan-binding domain-containing protein, partial [Desulfocucumaceae bacterium]